MQPGSIKPLTPLEVKEAFANAHYKTERYAEWGSENHREHRDGDLPATVWNDGAQYWSQNGKFHRDNGLPALIHPDGTMEWWERGELTGTKDNPPENAPDIFFFRPGQKTKSASKRQ